MAKDKTDTESAKAGGYKRIHHHPNAGTQNFAVNPQNIVPRKKAKDRLNELLLDAVNAEQEITYTKSEIISLNEDGSVTVKSYNLKGIITKLFKLAKDTKDNNLFLTATKVILDQISKDEIQRDTGSTTNNIQINIRKALDISEIDQL